MRNNLRFLSKVIYNLKRDYGEIVDFYKRTSSTYDIPTGVKTVVREKCSVNRAVVLPQDLARKFLYDAVFLKQDRPFAYGGLFAIGNRVILVDRKDLPLNYIIELSDYLIINSEGSGSRRYEVKNVDEFEGGFTYLLTVTELKGLELSQINDLILKQTLYFREQVLVSQGKTGFEDILSFQETIGFELVRYGYHEILTFDQTVTVVYVPAHHINNTLTFNEQIDFGLFRDGFQVDILIFTETVSFNMVRNRTISDTLTFVQSYELTGGPYVTESGDPYVTPSGDPYES